MRTVYGRATSSNVQVVMWTLAELGLDCTRLDYGGSFGGTDTAEYRAMNPNALVPVLREGDLVLWESAAILRYLAARHGDAAFWPVDPARRATLDMWAEWAKTTFYPVLIGRLFVGLVRTPAPRIDRAAMAAAAEAMKPLARMLDARIGRGPWLAGRAFSFADIACGALLYRYFTLPFERAETPALDAYYQRLCARPAYAQHVMVPYESLRVSA
jgi:glutathione S-transferase